MLVNGAKLGYSLTKPSGSATTYTDMPGLKQIPDMGADPEKVENTCLTDGHKMYEQGIGDLPEMTYTFKYDNTSEQSPYRLARQWAADGTLVYFKETLKDGTSTEYAAQVSVKRTGGSVNGVIEFQMTVMVQSEFKYTDPA